MQISNGALDACARQSTPGETFFGVDCPRKALDRHGL
jgi:hypothetical protein